MSSRKVEKTKGSGKRPADAPPNQPIGHAMRRAFVVVTKGAISRSASLSRPWRDFVLRPLLRYRGFLWFVSTPFFLLLLVATGLVAHWLAPSLRGFTVHLTLTWPLLWVGLQIIILAFASFLSSRYVFITRPARPGDRLAPSSKPKIVMVRKPQREARLSSTINRLKPTRQFVRWDFLGVSSSWLFGRLMQFTVPIWLRPTLYSFWGRSVGADLTESELPLTAYPSLNAVFTRRLKPGSRTVDKGPGSAPLVSPVDGVVVTAGIVVGDRLDQVKGVTYSLEQFLGECIASAQRIGHVPHHTGASSGAAAVAATVTGGTRPSPLGGATSHGTAVTSPTAAPSPDAVTAATTADLRGWRPATGHPSAAAATALSAGASVAGTATLVGSDDASMEALSLPPSEAGWESGEDHDAIHDAATDAATCGASPAASPTGRRARPIPSPMASPTTRTRTSTPTGAASSPGAAGNCDASALDATGSPTSPSSPASPGTARLTAETLLASQTRALYHLVIYLAPHDYHRVHAAADVTIRSVRHFPGTLFPINPAVARLIPNLFALNERVVMLGAWSGGFYSQALVGAYNVGSITLDFDESIVTNTPRRDIVNPNLELFSVDGVGCYCYESHYTAGVTLEKGDEVGRFNLGSTVVIVFEADRDFELLVSPGEKVRVGQPIGRSRAADGQ